jgi:hypothetical protein
MSPVCGSIQKRQGLRNPHAKIRLSGASVPQLPSGVSHEVTEATPTSGLSDGIVPSRFSRRILPLPLFRQAPYLFTGGVAFEPVSPTLTYR